MYNGVVMKRKEGRAHEFDATYQKIINNCEKLTPGYEQLGYLRRIIDECRRIEEYRFFYENEILEEEAYKRIMPRIIKRFYETIENKNEGSIGEPKFIYLEETGENYDEFYRNAARLLNEVSSDYRVKEKEMKFSGIRSNEMFSGKRISVKSSISDIVRIFEAMKKAEIISSKSTVQHSQTVYMF